jgi:hypothetical protein
MGTGQSVCHLYPDLEYVVKVQLVFTLEPLSQ